ncbi:uncharacterized protein LY79DRAFT_232025 [Colletotrichum navitas]|uniref:Uncharacterized protein n=1 Tax=Colletotrichum navitas TaxID=681940 RepID=A0AAD8PXI4_9PEZI|nr:uncharacterized protein LY79DRAFT_232025 [Colletotrichum navitas]KAK1589933.1 hypothetical protein LY79DRAFT_232025 [Colletotrichum navitas]
MAQRILVRCQSDLIPGPPTQRNETIANIICLHHWERDFDKTQDVLNSLGQYASNNVKCYFLLDNGTAGSKEPEIFVYRWDGKGLQPRPVNTGIVDYLSHIPFGEHLGQQAGLSDQEYIATYGQTAFAKVASSRDEQRQRWRNALQPRGKSFHTNHPEAGPS